MGNDCTLKLKGIELPDVNDARAIHEGQQVTTSRHQVTRLFFGCTIIVIIVNNIIIIIIIIILFIYISLLLKLYMRYIVSAESKSLFNYGIRTEKIFRPTQPWTF